MSINVRIEAEADELAAEPMSHVDLQGIRGIPGRRVQAIVSIVSVATGLTIRPAWTAVA